jgi:hypothetical protein
MFGPPAIAPLRCALKGPIPTRCALLASQVGDILTADPATDSVRNDWQNRSKVIRRSIPQRWDASWGWINRISITRWR